MSEINSRQPPLCFTLNVFALLACTHQAARGAESQILPTTSAETVRARDGQPLVAGDWMFFETTFPTYIYAVKLSDVSHTVWIYDPGEADAAPSSQCCERVDRGLVYSAAKSFANMPDGDVVAIEASSGKLLWRGKSVVGQPKANSSLYRISAPLVIHESVIVRISGSENRLRGYFTVFDLNTGQFKWRAYDSGQGSQTLAASTTTIDGATQRLFSDNSAFASWSNRDYNMVAFRPKIGSCTTRS